MKLSPVIRPVDNMGRVVIPNEIRKQMNLTGGKDSVEIFAQGDSIILRKLQSTCAFCNSVNSKMFEYKGLRICEKCLDEMNELRDSAVTTFE
ncbi:MAG: AbrB/MazE/SpoVT family DNA-binding domain-containing protein [Clostridia bacterium]|nr:AbrB/MazE/SpoVT family DNA-binding domain-containing protein [Clostridia bacterium]